MSKRMLIDAAHPEEIRVAILNGNRLEEFDVEAAFKRQIKGNIYLARVTRVEPSLQAAFVEYGGNRHGFLAFNEIHPDYYRIPVSDRAEFKSIYEPRRHGESTEAESDGDAADGAEPAAERNPGADAERPRNDAAEHGRDDVVAPAPASETPAQAAAAGADVIYDTLQPDTERDVDDVAAPLAEPERAPESDGGVGRDSMSGDATGPRAGNKRRVAAGRGAAPAAGGPGYYRGERRRGGSRRRATAPGCRSVAAGTDVGNRRRRRRGRRGSGRSRGAASALPLASSLQDPRSDQAPPDHAGAGHEGRARQQRRGADDVSVARRPLLRA